LGYTKFYTDKKKLNATLMKAHSRLGMISEKQYQEEVENLINKKQYLDAFLALHEYIFQYDSKPIEQFKRILAASNQNSQVYKLGRSLEPKSKEEVEKSIKFINELAKQNLKHGYVLDVFLANIYGSQKSYSVAFSYFDKALSHNPFMASVYIDFAQLLSEDYKIYLAWQCIEAVKDFMPGYNRLRFAKEMEERMKQLNPDFF